MITVIVIRKETGLSSRYRSFLSTGRHEKEGEIVDDTEISLSIKKSVT